jgi:hypothetical protein
MKNSAIFTQAGFIFAMILTMGVMLTAHCHFSYMPPWHGKGKGISVQIWTGREGSRWIRLPDSRTVGTGTW